MSNHACEDCGQKTSEAVMIIRCKHGLEHHKYVTDTKDIRLSNNFYKSHIAHYYYSFPMFENMEASYVFAQKELDGHIIPPIQQIVLNYVGNLEECGCGIK